MMTANLLDIPIIGGLTVGLAIFINGLVIRYILQFQRETREEYARRLTRAVIELESVKTQNIRLEVENDRLRTQRRRSMSFATNRSSQT